MSRLVTERKTVPRTHPGPKRATMLTAGLLARRVFALHPPSRRQFPASSGLRSKRSPATVAGAAAAWTGQIDRTSTFPFDPRGEPSAGLLSDGAAFESRTVGAGIDSGGQYRLHCLRKNESIGPERTRIESHQMAIASTTSVSQQLSALNLVGAAQPAASGGSPTTTTPQPVSAAESPAVAASSVIGSSSQQSAAVSQAQSALQAAERVVAQREADLRDARSAVDAASDTADQRRQALFDAESAERVALAEQLERGSLVNISV